MQLGNFQCVVVKQTRYAIMDIDGWFYVERPDGTHYWISDSRFATCFDSRMDEVYPRLLKLDGYNENGIKKLTN